MSCLLRILNDPPYGTERAYEAPQLALLKKRPEPEMRVFRVGDCAACAEAGQAVPRGDYNVELMLKSLAERGTVVGALGTCMDARALRYEKFLERAKRSSLDAMTEWTLWADKVLTS